MAEQRQEPKEDPGKAIKEQSYAEFEEKTKGKPTPTQEENDRAAMGEHVVDKEDDGSNPDPAGGPEGALTREGHRQPGQRQGGQGQERRTSEAAGGRADYQTRQTAPAGGVGAGQRPTPSPSSSGSRSE
jgi:hypothetical protein